MVLPQGSSSSSADVRDADSAEIREAPRRFERAITWTGRAGSGSRPPSWPARLARSSAHLRQLLERGICAWMGVPLLVDGKVRGAMSFTNAESQRRFAPEDLATAEELAGRVAAAIARSPGDTIG